MTYIEQFEQELVKKLQSAEDAASIVRWAGEQVLKSYKNGITAGQKPATCEGRAGWEVGEAHITEEAGVMPVEGRGLGSRAMQEEAKARRLA
jgi:hypothetical protein